MEAIIPIAIFICIFVMLMLLAHAMYAINDWYTNVSKKAGK